MTRDSTGRDLGLSPMTWEASERHMLEQCVQAFFPLATRTVEGRHGVVTTTSSPLAAHAGFRALKAGGTVADAAVAVALTQITTALGSYVSYAGIMQALYHKGRGERLVRWTPAGTPISRRRTRRAFPSATPQERAQAEATSLTDERRSFQASWQA
jgi:hypothetical protein